MIMISRLQPLFNILLSFHARGFALMGKKRKKITTTIIIIVKDWHIIESVLILFAKNCQNLSVIVKTTACQNWRIFET